MQTKTISLRVTPDFDRKLRIEAAKRDLNRSAFIRKALDEKLSKIFTTQYMPKAVLNQDVKK